MSECNGCKPGDMKDDCPLHGLGTDCGNCGGVRCMHFVLRDWHEGSGTDECDGWCCPVCRPNSSSETNTKRCPDCNTPIPELHLRCNDRLNAALQRAETAEKAWAQLKEEVAHLQAIVDSNSGDTKE